MTKNVHVIIVKHLTAGPVYIRVLIFLLLHYVQSFKHVKDTTLHQSAIFEIS